MKVVVLGDLDPESITRLRSAVPRGVQVETLAPAKAKRAPELGTDAEILIAGIVPRSLLERADRLHTLVIPYAGVPARTRAVLADFPRLRLLTSHFNAADAAEHAWALLLAAAKRLIPCDALLRRSDWSARYGSPSASLEGKALLLAGYGAIGRRLARYGRAFGMRTEAVNRSGGSDPGVDRLDASERLHERLAGADAVIAALPETRSTRGLFDREAFGRMKRGALFVNVGRGSCVDEEALYAALREGRIGAAGLDVWWTYPSDRDAARSTAPAGSPFHQLENVVMSPHRAGHTADRERNRMDSLAEIVRAIAEGTPIREVDRSEWY